MKYPRIASCLCGLLLVCLSTNTHAKSISSNSNSREDGDPMMALPSDGQPPQQEVHYVSLQPQSGAENHAPASAQYQEVVIEHQAVPVTDEHHQPQAQQVVYSQLEHQAPYQLVQVAAQAPSRHEYSLPEVQQPASVQVEVNAQTKESAIGAEYPGEIVYVGSNGQTSDESSLAGVANSLNQNSGLAATILTEVPVKDMPYEVLEKLKREYGVKVVATRERPGANLVINCDEHSANRDSSVCSKQSRYPQIAHEHYHYQAQPVVEYHTLEAAEHEHQTQSQPAQYQYQHQPAHVEVHEEAQLEHQPAQVRRFSHRGVMEEVIEQPAYQPTTSAHEQSSGPETHSTTAAISENADNQQQRQTGEQNEYYGSRTATTAAVSEQASTPEEAQPRTEAEQAHAEQTAQAQQTPANNQNESADQQGGFDEQPKQLEGEQNGFRSYSQ